MKASGITGKSYNVFHAHKSEKQQYYHCELYISLGENCNKCISALSTQFDLSYISKSHFTTALMMEMLAQDLHVFGFK